MARLKIIRLHPVASALGAVIIIAGALVIASHTRQPKLQPVIPVTKAPVKSENNNSASQASPKIVTAPTGTADSGSNSQLVSPYGTFVSTHKPSISGNTQEFSTCSTTPGATCYIKFTKDGDSTQLPAQTADGSGATSWLWNVKDAGLSEGNWTITAIATLNSQTKSVTDSLVLEVQP